MGMKVAGSWGVMADDKAKRIDSNAVKAVAWNPAGGPDGEDAAARQTSPSGMPPGMPPMGGMMPPGMGMPGMPPWMPGAAPGDAGAGPVNEPTPEMRRLYEKQNDFMNGVVAASKHALDDLHRGLPSPVAEAGFIQKPDEDLLRRLGPGK